MKTDTPVVSKKTVRKVDLGAAAVYAQIQKDTSKDDLFANSDVVSTQETAQITQSAPNELGDFFPATENKPVASIPPFHSGYGGNTTDGTFGSFEAAPGSKQQNDDNFADFSSFSQVQSLPSPNDDFADFQSSGNIQQPSKQNGDANLFNDFTSSSNQELLSQPVVKDTSIPPAMQQGMPMQTMSMVS